MAHDVLVALHRLTYAHPTGEPVFTDLSESLGAEIVGVAGRNGCGKTTLGRLVAGTLEPTAGRIDRTGRVAWVGQSARPTSTGPQTLAAVAGLEATLQALARLARGTPNPDDLDAVDGRWDLATQWRAQMHRLGLEEGADPAALSGGQRMLLALAGAFCSEARFVVLDEPSNHLDQAHRRWLAEQLNEWRAKGKGALVISHDRELLAQVDRTVEPAPPGLHRYGGGWATVQAQRQARIGAAADRLAQARVERQRAQERTRTQAERSARKNAAGARERIDANQSKLALNAQRERAQRTSAALRTRHHALGERLHDEVSQAWKALSPDLNAPRFVLPRSPQPHPGRASLSMEALVPPWGWRVPLSWSASGMARVGVSGANGSGKSTLLRLLAGEVAPRAGQCRVAGTVALLRQSLEWPNPKESLLATLQRQHTGLDEAALSQMLAQANITRQQAHQPVALLSGGEQLRGALLCAAVATPPPSLLLLDEPTNHLDLESIEALESMLSSWPASFVVVSHDEVFLARLHLTHRLELGPERCEVRALA